MSDLKEKPETQNGQRDKEKGKYRYRIEIQQMMFVSGESNDPPEITTSLIEDIVREQVIEIITQCTKTSSLRGVKSIAPEDVIFLIRHDKAKVNRLRTYLSWKDVRKNARDQESGDIGTGNDLIDDSAGANVAGTSSGAIDNKMLAKQKKSKIRLPWELQFMFSEQPLDDGKDDNNLDDGEREAAIAGLKRLKANDDRTKNMTKKEYVHWSECRQASFTFRKAKRFKDWCGLSSLVDSRPHDDVIDILGFLTFEIVCSLTEEALKVKELQRAQLETKNGIIQESKKRQRHYLFDEPEEAAKPIQPHHVDEAWRRLQRGIFATKTLGNFNGFRSRYRPRLI
ncbi:unnamed protein product [Kuraishia capsulata CBS 1993]|uniref:Transcription initiation protein SPT3 n=1 Tax=Kuraishia capsulata CBS 1993 TaxID=1382522 RepID=W6MR51_9ASCO|nr:uncharacterized protein KUCA_T00005178001 [Kuraishia capsulata CBS 1993]CDK29191.1 unnamed protein product [Kuraishia capsulata CBS 1993]